MARTPSKTRVAVEEASSVGRWPQVLGICFRAPPLYFVQELEWFFEDAREGQGSSKAMTR